MKRIALTALFAALSMAPVAADSAAGDSVVAVSDTLFPELGPRDVARGVDDHFYYPQVHGLEALRARLIVPALDTLFASNGAAVPEIEFLWKSPDTRTVLVGRTEAQQLRAQVMRLLDGRGELIVPRPLAETLARYEEQHVEGHGDTVQIVASTSDTTVDLRSMRLTVERNQWRLIRMEATTTRGTLVSQNEFQQIHNLNLLSGMDVRIGDVEANIRLEYAPFETYWLVSRIVYAVRGGSVGRGGNFEILLDSFRVNADAASRRAP